MKRNILFLIACFFLLSFPFAGYTLHEQPLWKAGVAKVNITPEESMWMAGYASRNRPSEGKRTDLWAKALVVEDANGNRAVFVSTDLVGIRKRLSENVRGRIEKQYGLTKSQIILNSSHTHTGPETESSRQVFALDAKELAKIDNYAKKLEDKLVSLVGQALKKLQPAKLFSGNGVTRFQVNRRNNKEASLIQQTALNGPNDYAVPVIRVIDNNSKIIAVLFGYACHNTVLGDYKWSGDYAGFAQIELEKQYPGSIALFFQCAGADQNPLPRRSPELAKQYGKELAAAVERVISEKMNPLESKLSVSYSEIDLPFEKAPPTREELINIINDTSSSRYPNYLKQNAKVFLNTLEKGGSLMTSYPYPVQVWKLGDQPIFALGGELTVGYSIDLKKIFGYDIFVFGYCNDVMAYIPTATILKEGGYEGTRSPIFTTPWGSGTETIIIDQMVQLAEKVGVPK